MGAVEAGLALNKAAGNTALAVTALNSMGLLLPDGSACPVNKLRGVV